MRTAPPIRFQLFHWLSQCAFCLGLIGLVLAGRVTAEETLSRDYIMRQWDLDEGLPSTCINAVARTRDGYVWLATHKGIARFDGLRFTTFNEQNCPELKNNRINTLTTDRKGNLWIVTGGGGVGNLIKYRNGTFETINLNNATRSKRVNALAIDSSEQLWLGTEGAGLIKFYDGRTQTYTTTNGLPSDSISRLITDNTGRIWYVSCNQLGRVEGESCQLVPVPGLAADVIQEIAPARDGGLWLALGNTPLTGTRIIKIKTDLTVVETPACPWPQSSERSRTGALFEDKTGNLWCGTLGNGVFICAPGGIWQKLSRDLSSAKAEIICLVPDEAGAIWIGTRATGLNEAIPRQQTTLFLPADCDQSSIQTVCARRNGSIWAGTDDQGIFSWQNHHQLHFGASEGLASLRVNVLLEDSHTNLWTGTGDGLFRFNHDRFEAFRDQAILGNVTTLFEDRQNQLWAGTAHGLFNVTDGRQFKSAQGVPERAIMAMAQDHENRLWIAVDGRGLFVQQGDQFNAWQPNSGTPNALRRWRHGENIRVLRCDSADQSMWVATYGYGLFRIEGDRIRMWDWERDKLPSNHIFSLLEDGENNLWFSTENGIFGTTKRKLLEYPGGGTVPLLGRLTPANGLPYKVCSGGGQPAAAMAPDGRMWFPNGTALIAFDATVARHNDRTWPPIIEEVRVETTPVIPTAAGIELVSGTRNLEIFFTSPNILFPDQLRFRYRLEGLDQGWFSVGSRRSAQYSDLPPGEYVFHVMTSTRTGIWNDQEATLKLTVHPRLWETRWFQALAILLGIVIAGLVARQWERVRSRRNLAALERTHVLEGERARIARDIHDDLGANLTQVALLSDMARTSVGNPEELREQLGQVSASAREMAQSLEAIVWAVRPENDTLRSLLEYLSRRTDELFDRFPRQYQFVLPAQMPDCFVHPEVRHNVFLAYKEALTNALRHAQAKAVRMDVVCEREQCRISIADDGLGFDPARTRAEGAGLKNMRHRMKDIGGEVSWQTAPGQGTTVRLTFPLPPEEFATR